MGDVAGSLLADPRRMIGLAALAFAIFFPAGRRYGADFSRIRPRARPRTRADGLPAQHGIDGGGDRRRPPPEPRGSISRSASSRSICRRNCSNRSWSDCAAARIEATRARRRCVKRNIAGQIGAHAIASLKEVWITIVVIATVLTPRRALISRIRGASPAGVAATIPHAIAASQRGR